MDGLECSEIKKSELEFSGRTDAEYYQKKFLQYQNIIEAHNILPLSKVADFLIGPFGSAYDTSLYVEQSNYRYIRGQDVKPFLLQDTSPRYMEERDFNRLNKYALATNDILISVVGTLGNACIIQEHEVPAIFSQMPITNFLQSIEGGKEMTLADKEKAYLWFISFVYRLRNALFHEIIDPLNDEWQVIFKNSYHVLKQVVDQNIWRLKQLKLLPSASQAAAEEDYNREPPPDIDWPTDEEAKFTWFYYEMLKLNKDGARVLLKGKIDFAEHHYETECTVRWNESLSETAIKNASITSVVDSQEKELAAAI